MKINISYLIKNQNKLRAIFGQIKDFRRSHKQLHDLEIEIDTYLIEQVLINLILNAVEACDFLPDAKIVVSDNGKGIPTEILDRIFVPFFSTKKSGSGIGLSLCKQIMMLHKGKIQIFSKEGKGTVVNLYF